MGETETRGVTTREIEDKRREVEMVVLEQIRIEVEGDPRADELDALAAALEAVQAPMVARMGVNRGR